MRLEKLESDDLESVREDDFLSIVESVHPGRFPVNVEQITGMLVEIVDGEYAELWITTESRPYDLKADYTKIDLDMSAEQAIKNHQQRMLPILSADIADENEKVLAKLMAILIAYGYSNSDEDQKDIALDIAILDVYGVNARATSGADIRPSAVNELDDFATKLLYKLESFEADNNWNTRDWATRIDYYLKQQDTTIADQSVIDHISKASLYNSDDLYLLNKMMDEWFADGVSDTKCHDALVNRVNEIEAELSSKNQMELS